MSLDFFLILLQCNQLTLFLDAKFKKEIDLFSIQNKRKILIFLGSLYSPLIKKISVITSHTK